MICVKKIIFFKNNKKVMVFSVFDYEVCINKCDISKKGCHKPCSVLFEIKAGSFLAWRPLRRALYISEPLPCPGTCRLRSNSECASLQGNSSPWNLHGGFPSIPCLGEGWEWAVGFLPVLPQLGRGSFKFSPPKFRVNLLSNQASAAWFIAIQHSCWFICRM